MSNAMDAMDTMEALVRFARIYLEKHMPESEDKTDAIACAALFKTWTPGKYKVGDIRLNPATGYPRECILAHDSMENADWTIDVATLWRPYHSRSAQWALPYEPPTGSHDMYKVGEYMVYNGSVYVCKLDTNYNPDDLAQAWERIA